MINECASGDVQCRRIWRPSSRLLCLTSINSGGKVLTTDAGWSSSVARRAHNPEVAGSNPVPATTTDPVPEGAGSRRIWAVPAGTYGAGTHPPDPSGVGMRASTGMPNRWAASETSSADQVTCPRTLRLTVDLDMPSARPRSTFVSRSANICWLIANPRASSCCICR